ncbi:MAG: hypothetical protein JW765_05190 [Deltaproteobacteria bacterium]|nr:hypothetical protein [Candidatus Zymogenaceae bacterium]
MKRLKLYLDTSILGALFDTEEPDRVKIAGDLLQLIKNGVFEGCISLLTIQEVSRAPQEIRNELERKITEFGFTTLIETEESIELAESYLKAGVIPKKYRDDARHIAIGVYHEVDYIVSWNYRHMVNIITRRLINSTNLKMGYNPIEIISPEEVTGDGKMEI